MDFIQRLITTEHSHFRAMSPQAQRLTVSYSLYNLALPFFSLFINAFLFRETSSFLLVALYNIGIFIGLPLGFYINGLLLSRFTFNKLYLFSCITQGLSVIPLIFLKSTSAPHVLMFGLGFGVSAGLFWSNRHYFSLHTVHDEKRNYFEGIVMSVATIINIIIPAFIGWFIVTGPLLQLYTHDTAYKMLIIIATIIMYFAGAYISSVKVRHEPVKLFLPSVSSLWKKFRYMSFFNGVKSGVFFYAPTLVVLSMIGNEAALGTLQSLAAILATVVSYGIGRKTASHHRFLIAFIGYIILTIGSIFLNIYFTILGALVFIFLDRIAVVFEMISFLPVMYQSIEKDSAGEGGYNYARICDTEFFLNAGRSLGALLFITIAFTTTQVLSLRINLLLAALFQLVSLLMLYQLINQRDYR